MEFPDLGKHCAEKTCKQLDFLPLKCDVCEQDFCKDHFTYAAHKCPFAYKKDVQVPVCPLCNRPIPIKKGEIPDVVVGEHMDRDCGCRPGKKEKVRTGSLSLYILWIIAAHAGAEPSASGGEKSQPGAGLTPPLTRVEPASRPRRATNSLEPCSLSSGGCRSLHEYDLH
ncbi:AN1-type zinc finger protein 2A isoform X1 [Myotis lucifugus]|uniref:AN1-type zinc finger protein 2A isoform X1 n=1 Tax=Myotis lucifugus TaxID=59463 RepID=UPI0006D703C6|nr:AN1-type zinc finger protein 2A isoform X1 [Myotis lucifugus]